MKSYKGPLMMAVSIMLFMAALIYWGKMTASQSYTHGYLDGLQDVESMLDAKLQARELETLGPGLWCLEASPRDGRFHHICPIGKEQL